MFEKRRATNVQNRQIEEETLLNQLNKKNNNFCNFKTALVFFFSFIIFIFFTFIIVLHEKESNNSNNNNNLNTQSRLSYTYSNSTNDMSITWASMSHSQSNYLIYSDVKNNYTTKLNAETSIFKEWPYTKYIHRVYLNNLNYDNEYVYTINNDTHQSDKYYFNIPKKKNNFNVILWGDMGVESGETRENIIENINLNKYDFMFHLGDIAYNLQENSGLKGDLFLSQLEPATSKYPYMVIPGNHESYKNFTEYSYRFTMPNFKENNNYFYTLEFPPLKMININTEAFYFNSLKNTLEKQIQFIEKELSITDRSIYPWLIVTGHRPMYCSNKNSDDCVNWKRDQLRNQLENMFLKYNLTFFIAAHEHSYERICPIYNGICQNNTKNLTQFNLSQLIFPIHLTTGAGGCREGHEKFQDIKPDWSEIRNRENGYAELYVDYNILTWKEYVVRNKIRFLIDSIKIYN